MPRGNACSRVNWMRRVRRSRSVTKARANSIASTGDSLASPQCAISKPCKQAKSWRSLPLNAELAGCHGAACSRLSQTGPSLSRTDTKAVAKPHVGRHVSLHVQVGGAEQTLTALVNPERTLRIGG